MDAKTNQSRILDRLTKEPIPFVVLDDFLPKKQCNILHEQMILNPMWRTKNPLSKHLHNSQPMTQGMQEFLSRANEFIYNNVSTNLELIDYWALLYSKNTDGNMHADFGQVTLTYWLTPDRSNCNPETGGLIIYDVQRPSKSGANIYLASGEKSKDLVGRESKTNVIVPYRANRVVIFDSSHYHKTHSPQFDISCTSGMRMNITAAYATPSHVHEQLQLIETSSRKTIHEQD
jgi:urease beta subunit